MSEMTNGADLVETPEKTPYDRQWLGSILRPALIATLISCINIAVLSMLQRLYPGLGDGYAQGVVTISLLAVLLACATTTWLAQPGKRHLRRPLYRLAELLFVLVVARLVVWFTMGTMPPPAQLLYRPLEGLLDGPFIFAAILIGLSWLFAGELTADLLRLALQPDELFAIEEDRIGELIRTSNSDRPAILQRLVSRWVGGGILLVLIAASVRIERPEVGFLAITRQNIDPTIIAAVVVYFLAGLLLVSQGQLAILRTRWLLERIPTSEQVLGQWPIYVFALLVGIGLLAALLPFGGTFYLAYILTAIVTFFFNTIYAIFRFFMGLLLLLIALLSGEQPDAPPMATPPPAPPPMMPEALPQSAGMPEWAGGALFWVVMVLFLSYAAFIYLREKGIEFSWLRSFWQLLLTRWQLLFGNYQQWQKSRLRRVSVEQQEKEEARRGWFRRRQGWRHLTPTQQIRYFYLNTVEEAAANGFMRAAGETPLQFAARLRAHLTAQSTISTEESINESPDRQRLHETPRNQLPALDPDRPNAETDGENVNRLTEAFLQTRYTNRRATESEAVRSASIWERLRKRLQMTKQPSRKE
ncbi:MAG TPA: hypothetical protein P5121_08600 [Caldilineaceae bacterium]|nr:hypothetical protein [Caldilineaceae bacterium]